MRIRGHPDETDKTRNWEIFKKFMIGLLDEKLQDRLLTLYTGEQFAMNPPTVQELRATCRNFLMMMSVNPRSQPSQNQGSRYQKSTQMTGATQPPASNAKNGAPSSKINWTQAPEGNLINLNTDRGNRACFSCGEEGHI